MKCNIRSSYLSRLNADKPASFSEGLSEITKLTFRFANQLCAVSITDPSLDILGISCHQHLGAFAAIPL